MTALSWIITICFVLAWVVHWRTYKRGAWALMKEEKSIWDWTLWLSLGMACTTFAFMFTVALRDLIRLVTWVWDWFV